MRERERERKMVDRGEDNSADACVCDHAFLLRIASSIVSLNLSHTVLLSNVSTDCSGLVGDELGYHCIYDNSPEVYSLLSILCVYGT